MLKSFLETLLFEQQPEEINYIFKETKKQTIIEEIDPKICPLCPDIRMDKHGDNTYICSFCNYQKTIYECDVIADEKYTQQVRYNTDNKSKQNNNIDKFLDIVSQNFPYLENRLEINQETKRIFSLIIEKNIKRSSCRISLLAILFQTIASNFYCYDIRSDDICKFFCISRKYLAEQSKLLDIYEEAGIFRFNSTNVLAELKLQYSMINHKDEVLIKIHTLRKQLRGYQDNHNLFYFTYKAVCFLIKYQLYLRTTTMTKILAILHLVLNLEKSYLNSVSIYTTAYKKITHNMRQEFLPLLSHSPIMMKKIMRLRRLFRKHGYLHCIDSINKLP